MLKKLRQLFSSKVEQDHCSHENFHQIELTGRIKCDDCGKIFEDMTLLN